MYFCYNALGIVTRRAKTCDRFAIDSSTPFHFAQNDTLQGFVSEASIARPTKWGTPKGKSIFLEKITFFSITPCQGGFC